MQVLSKFKMGTLCESTAGSDPERALAGGGCRLSMAADQGPRDPGAEPRWGIAPGSS